jgi:hypothetical protein
MIICVYCKWDKQVQDILRCECLSYIVTRENEDCLQMRVCAKNSTNLVAKLSHIGRLEIRSNYVSDQELVERSPNIRLSYQPHEQKILDILNNGSDGIHWFVDGTGEFKLSAFAKELRQTHGLLKIPTDSCKSMYAHVIKHSGQPVYLFDMTYKSPNEACVQALEMISMGHFVFGEIEVVMPNPRVLVFASCKPPQLPVHQCDWMVQVLSVRITESYENFKKKLKTLQ